MADDDAKRRAALFSAYFHATNRSGAGAFSLPESVRPEPLGKAVDALLEDRGPHATRHRRMATGKLLGAGLRHPAVVKLAKRAGFPDLEEFDQLVIAAFLEQLPVVDQEIVVPRESVVRESVEGRQDTDDEAAKSAADEKRADDEAAKRTADEKKADDEAAKRAADERKAADKKKAADAKNAADAKKAADEAAKKAADEARRRGPPR